jgi:RHS repeat-associated protein
LGVFGWLNLDTDPVTGLTQTGQRLYDQDVQQFISPDPLLDTGAPNPYLYARSNPIMASDPSGLFGCSNLLKPNCSALEWIIGMVTSRGRQQTGSGESGSVSGGSFGDGMVDGVSGYGRLLSDVVTEPVSLWHGYVDSCGGTAVMVMTYSMSCGVSMVSTTWTTTIDDADQHGWDYVAGTLTIDALALLLLRKAPTKITAKTTTSGGLLNWGQAAKGGAGRVAGTLGELPKPNAVVGDLAKLEPGNALEGAKAGRISQLTDQELMDSVFAPKDGGYMYTYKNSDVLANGNHRAAELLRRAGDPSSSIDLDTPIYLFNR